MDFAAFMIAISGSQSTRWTPRQKRLEAYRRALRGKLYAHLKYAYTEERSKGFSGERVLLDERRPSVQERLPEELVRDMTGMLFGEAHRPTFVARDDPSTSDWLTSFITDTSLWLVAFQMLWEGSVGSCCVVLRVLGKGEDDAEGGFTPVGKGAYHFEVWPGHQCRPIFHRTAPTELKMVERVWFVGEDALRADGYDVDALNAAASKKHGGQGGKKVRQIVQSTDWVLRLLLGDQEEQWFLPVPKHVYERTDWVDSNWQLDAKRTITHKLGEVPGRWVRPLPFDDDELFPDGLCLFDAVIDYQMRIDRTTSQVGRAFDYAGDPQMARIREGSAPGGGPFGASDFEEPLAIGGTASDVIDQTGGDVKFVEITADGLKAAMEVYVKQLRDAAREAGSMSRITPDGNARTELSAVAMKMLNFSQTVLADILRITCVETGGLVPLMRLAMRMYARVAVALPSYAETAKPNPEVTIDTAWPEYYELHGLDKLNDVQATAAAVAGGLLSSESGAAYTAGQFDVQDAADELKRIQGEQDAADDRELANHAATAEVDAKFSPKPSDSAPAA